MPEIHINRSQLDFVVRQVVQAIGHNTALHPVEAILGLCEAAARAIAAQEGTHLLHNELLRVAAEHMQRTVRAAYSASGKNPEGIKNG